MWLYMKMAWRNVLRNKRRTLIAALAIGIGLGSMIFTDALIIGMKKGMIQSVTDTFLGDAQIHRQNYRETRENDLLVHRPAEVLARLAGDSRVRDFSPRVISAGMISSPANVSAVVVYGVDPAKERDLSEVDEYLQQGRYLEAGERGLIMGRHLADTLEVALGERVVISLSKPESGDIVQQLFKITGVFKMPVEELEKGTVFVPLTLVQEMLGIDDRYHEIAVKFRDPAYAYSEDETDFTREYTTNQNEAVNWPELVPQMKMVLELSNLSLGIMGIIIFGVVVFGLINTLFMSLYERMFEFGVIRAIGTRAGGVRRLVMLEAAALGIISILLGMAMGFLLTLVVTKTGIDYRGIEFAGSTFTKMLYPVMEWRQYILHPLMIFGFTLLVSIYPAVHAGRMKVADALRRSL